MTLDYRTWQGAADHGFRRRRHHLAAARGAGGLKLTPFYPMSRAGPRRRRCPAAISPGTSFDDEVDEARERWRFLGEVQAQRLVARLRVERLKADPWRRQGARADLGPALGRN